MANATLSPGTPGKHAVAQPGDQALALAVDPGATGSTLTRVAQAVSMQITTSISTVASDGEAIAVDEIVSLILQAIDCFYTRPMSGCR